MNKINYIIWRSVSPNLLCSFEAVQRRAIKCIEGRMYDYYSESEYRDKLKALNILPINIKFIMTDLV